MLRDIDAKAADAYFRGDDKALTLYGTKSGPQASPGKWTGKLLSPKGEDDEECPGTPSGSPKTLALPGTPSKGRPGSSSSVASRAPSNQSVARSTAGDDEAVYRPTRIAIWSEELGARKRQGAEMRLKQEMDLQVGPKCLDDYRRQLVNGSGSLAGAWRYRMDEECTGRMSFMQFVMAIWWVFRQCEAALGGVLQ